MAEEEPDDVSRPEGTIVINNDASPHSATVPANRRVSLPPMRLTSILEQDEKDKASWAAISLASKANR